MRCKQYHNQPADSPLHRWLAEMWAAVRAETAGCFEVTTFAENAKIPGGDPEALEMLIAGELEFFTLMGGLLGTVVPVAEIQCVPFAFKSQAHVFSAMDGELGDYLRAELAAGGVYALPRATFENGFRQITTSTKPIRDADDLVGLKIRTPAGTLFIDLFESLGAEPRAINLNQLYRALKTGVVGAQENPLVVVEFNRLYEVQRYVNVTNHMWSGFNLLANLKAWKAIPRDIQEAIERTAAQHAVRQRRETDALNVELAAGLATRGMIFKEADTASFRRLLGPFYARWKKRFGTRAWSLLEAHAGPLG